MPGIPAPIPSLFVAKLSPDATQFVYLKLFANAEALVPAGAPSGEQDVIVSRPSYYACCIVGTLTYQDTPVNSAPVKIALQ